MWGSSPRKEETLHIRVMGSLAVGKTTLVSTAVTRTAQKRSMPYIRSKHNQRFVCSTKSPNGDVIVAELVDSKGNETLEMLVSETLGVAEEDAEEQRSLLTKDDRSVRWCYIIMFDFTRHATYTYARQLAERIRAMDAANHSCRSVIFLLGNKKEMLAAATLSAWLRDQHHNLINANDLYTFVFVGSAIDNSFVCMEDTGTKKVGFIEKAYGLKSSELSRHGLMIDQLLYLLKLRVEMVNASRSQGVPARLFSPASSSNRQVNKKFEDRSQNGDHEPDEEDSNCCRRGAWCCTRRPQ